MGGGFGVGGSWLVVCGLAINEQPPTINQTQASSNVNKKIRSGGAGRC